MLGETLESARLGATRVEVGYEPLPAIVGVREAIAAGAFQGGSPVVARGDVAAGLARATHVFAGELELGGQEHFYLETQASLAMVDEAGQVFVQSSTQHPTETQEIVAHVLGRASHRVTVQCLRMGGAFGGKEMQPHGYAAVAALGATLTGRPVRVRLTRTQDITMTGKRHGFHTSWRVGFDADGRIEALEATLTADGGWSLDLSEPILARALCHVDNAYFIPDIRGAGSDRSDQQDLADGVPRLRRSAGDARDRGHHRSLRTPARDRARRPAPPQLLRRGRDDAVRPAGPPPRTHAARPGTRSATPAGTTTVAGAIQAFNDEHPHAKRGLAITPVKFGISFNFTAFNQAGALVHVYKDGSVLINHGGTEMGQGLHTKMLQVAATALGLPLEKVRLAPTRTDKVPNTSATAACAGADLNGGRSRTPATRSSRRLTPVAEHPDASTGTSSSGSPTTSASSSGRPASTRPRG